MSLLHRWSLPNRGLARGKSLDAVSSGQSKFPTIHIGQPVLRRRANLSSAFSTLLEKPENRPRIRNAEGSSEATDDLPLLVSRRTNAPTGTDFNYSQTPEYQEAASIKVTSLRKSSGFGFTTRNTETGGTKLPPFLTRGNLSQDTHQIDETPKIRSFSLSSTDTTEKGVRDGALALQSIMLTVDCERVRSASSSYPSEGMRSPVTSSRSLEPVTSHTMNYLAEYRCYGRYPSQNMCDLSNASIREGYDAGSIVRENIQAFNIDGDTPSNRAISNSTPGPNSPSLTTSHNGGTELARCDDTDGEHEQKKLSLKSRNTAPIFENENGISSQREASFTSSQRPNTQVSSDDGHDYQAGGRNASSTDRLRLSEDTDSTIPTAVRRSSVEGGEDVWSTVHDVGEKQLSRPASWRQLFVFSASNHASDAAFSQRIQNFRLRKWAKKVGLKTKARFQLMGRPIPITAKRTNSKVRPHKWYHVKKRRRRGGNATRRLKKNSRNKKEKHWSVGKTLEATKERVKQHKKIADDFLGSLVKRKSTQLGTLKFEKESKAPVTHKRVQSCPASIINS